MIARLVALTDSIPTDCASRDAHRGRDRKNEDQDEHERQGEINLANKLGEVRYFPPDQEVRAIRQRIEDRPHQSSIRRG